MMYKGVIDSYGYLKKSHQNSFLSLSLVDFILRQVLLTYTQALAPVGYILPNNKLL